MKPNGANWRHGRARLDLSAEEAAARLRINHKYLLNIETNQPKALPSPRLVYRAARLYDVSFEHLVCGDEDETQPEPQKEPDRPERDRDPSGPPNRDDPTGPPRVNTDLAAAS